MYLGQEERRRGWRIKNNIGDRRKNERRGKAMESKEKKGRQMRGENCKWLDFRSIRIYLCKDNEIDKISEVAFIRDNGMQDDRNLSFLMSTY